MAKVLFNLRNLPSNPTLDDAARHLGVARAALDESYGLVQVDPDEKLYSVLVESEAAEALPPASAEGKKPDYEGPFSNPKIAPFGPPEY